MEKETKLASEEAQAVQEKQEVKDSVFIEENDVFEVKVEYYKEKNKLFVKDISENFDTTRKTSVFSMTFRIPTLGDYEFLSSVVTRLQIDLGNLSVADVNKLEFARMMRLAKVWSSKNTLDMDNIAKMDAKVAKGIVVGIRSEIGMEGFF